MSHIGSGLLRYGTPDAGENAVDAHHWTTKQTTWRIEPIVV